jgi:methionine sulfoxide reductase heme-binding subunit
MNTAWYIARAGGMVAYALLTVTVVIGLTMSGRAKLRRWPRFAVEDVHRFANLLTWSFIAVHVFALLSDNYLPFSLAAFVVPGIAPYRPLPTSLGVVAMELLAALAVTNLFRRRISYALWRRTHYLNFAVWLLALFHGLSAGADSDTLWGLALYVSSAGLVGGLTAWRVLQLRSVRPGAIRLCAPLAAVVAADLAIFLDLGLVR